MKRGVGDDPFADEEAETPEPDSDMSSPTEVSPENSLTDAIVEAIEAIESGDENKNISLRDREMKALLLALDENQAAREDLASALGLESDVPRSAIIRTLLRKGLQAEAPAIHEDLATAMGKYARESI